MSGVTDAAQESGSGAALSGRDRLAFAAFREVHFRAHYSFVYARFGDRRRALRIAEETFSQLAANWRFVLRQEIPAAYAWSITREAIRREFGYVQRRAGAAREVFESARAGLALMDDATGLFEAILELPERQYEVVVLRYILELDLYEVAAYLGVSETNARGLARRATDRLSRILNRHQSIDPS
ncbi:RNA polymerase sigma factor [Kitasatospora sp. NPDC088160]|uniref:RNA polymerase sigma factor n=1 Tax=Kitasatospora sp. NPDC088160 TaxID=3364072 RepID=UPI00382DE9DA